MIKVEYDKKTEEMVFDVDGNLEIVLNEYSALTKELFKTTSRMLGKDEAKRVLKEYYKIGLKRAIKKEGEEND